MVSSRQVHIRAGDALVPARDNDLVKDLLVCTFDFLLKDSIEHNACGSADDRLGYISKHVSACFAEHREGGVEMVPSLLRAKHVHEQAANHFPPCFSQLQLQLMEKGRLKHHARVAYTLFLKDIGMPRSEALDFWASYYSRPSASVTTCSHTWQESERRFVYSIAHLYGQEGGRKNYSAHACSTIQKRARTAPNEQLVCPFSVMDLHDDYDATVACKAALCQKLHLDEKAVLFRKPSQWYAWSMQSKS
jgi:DNA primase large subunit